MYKIPLEYFVSPVTKQPLSLVDATTLIDKDGNAFHKSIEHGFWNFIPRRSPIYSDEQWETFNQLISNFMVSYSNHPEVNVSYEVRPDALAFGDFCAFKGKVLDIGCGPHKVPSYIKYKRNPDAEYFGLDVVGGEHPREYEFVQGMGEHLPFHDDLFDITVSGTSILHYVNIQAGIVEALRVTHPRGYLCVWLGIKSKDAPTPKQSPDWYKKLEVPKGAENPFHYRRYSESDIEAVFKQIGARLIDKAVHPADEWRKNVFYRLKK